MKKNQIIVQTKTTLSTLEWFYIRNEYRYMKKNEQSFQWSSGEMKEEGQKIYGNTDQFMCFGQGL